MGYKEQLVLKNFVKICCLNSSECLKNLGLI